MFDFVMKIAFISSSLQPIYRFNSNAWWALDMNKVSYEYTERTGFSLENMPFGKKSYDGKTLFWYHNSNASTQLNSPSYTYYCEAIG